MGVETAQAWDERLEEWATLVRLAFEQREELKQNPERLLIIQSKLSRLQEDMAVLQRLEEAPRMGLVI